MDSGITRMKASKVASASNRRIHRVETKQPANTTIDRAIPTVAEDAVSLTQATVKAAASSPPNQGNLSRANARQAGQTSRGRASTDRLASTRSASLGFPPITA